MSEAAGTAGARSGAVALECDVSEVTKGRSLLLDFLAAHTGAPDDHTAHRAHEALARDAAAVLSELLMNAMLHGTPDEDGNVSARWWLDDDGALTLQVKDEGGFGEPRLEDADSGAAGGRGLVLVDAASDSWSVDLDDGTVVTAVLRPGVSSTHRLHRG